MSQPPGTFDIPYVAPLLGNIRQALTGLHGFDAMALEIIQNADDAGAKRIQFDVTKKSLLIWNDATFATCGLTATSCPWELNGGPNGKRKACDFHAISMVGSSNKYHDPSLIGRFGIGFVSVYQITDAPIVRSADIQLKLDPLHAKSHKSTVPPIQGTEFELPWAFDGDSPVRRELSASSISIADLETVVDDIRRVSLSCLLFLRNVGEIDLRRKGQTICRVKREWISDRQLRLSFAPETCQENWYVIEVDAADAARSISTRFPILDRLARQTTVRIAFPLDQTEGRLGKLFAYLPTQQDAPVPCHINADFFPEQNRIRVRRN